MSFFFFLVFMSVTGTCCACRVTCFPSSAFFEHLEGASEGDQESPESRNRNVTPRQSVAGIGCLKFVLLLQIWAPVICNKVSKSDRDIRKKKKNLEDSLFMYCVWPERHIVLYYTFNKMLLSCTVVVQEGRFHPLMAAAAINASSHRHGHLVYKDLVWTASLSCLLLPKCCPTL